MKDIEYMEKQQRLFIDPPLKDLLSHQLKEDTDVKKRLFTFLMFFSSY
jgi:hypothetical protein